MRLGRLLVVLGVWGVVWSQAGCVGCGDLPVTYSIGGAGPGSCTDGLSNGDEVGVDCGGSCQPCAGSPPTPASCTDGVLNGDETAVDCGGRACPACGEGQVCRRSEDCASGVCTGGVCAAPSCTDGVKNGTETGLDCGGGTCPACTVGETCGAPSDCQSPLLCLDGVCATCTDSSQCSAGFECRQGGCVPDTFPPTVELAFLPGSSVLRIRFSEPMLQDDSLDGVLNPDLYCVELTDETPHECSPSDAFWVGSILTPVDERTVDMELPFGPGAGRYTVQVAGGVDRTGNALGSPRHADFEVGGPLRLLEASSRGADRLLLTFSRAVSPGPDAAGSAGCTSPETCATRYHLSGSSPLGAVLSAEVLPPPRDNEVLLTHAAPQRGGQYTVLAANGVDGDGLEDSTAGAILSASGGKPLGARPLDRAPFTGRGASARTFQEGPVQVDPFADGVDSLSAVAYRGRVLLGPDGNGARAVRLEADGSRTDSLAFAFRKDTLKQVGTRSSNAASAPFPSIGFSGCQANTDECGPDNEDGRALFASGSFGGTEWLAVGGTRSGGGLGYLYMSRDEDATLDFKYVDLSQALDGAAARSFSAVGVFAERTYLGVPTRGGTRRPELLALLRAPAADAQGLDARGNGAGPCRPATHDVCNLAAHLMPGIGASGSPANPAPTVGIDFVAQLNGKLYLGNNGGLVRATLAQPLDYQSAPSHWVSITPSATEYRSRVSLTSDKQEGLEPADRAWTRLVVFNGHAYLGRNTTEGPQLWRCDPAIVSGPAPATAEDCDAGDWVLVAGNGTGEVGLSQFDDPDNTRVTLLAVSGGRLYVGFDNAVDGVSVYRSTVAMPTRREDFTAWGSRGFGLPALNTRLGDAVAVESGAQGYLYVPVSGGPGTPVRLYRQKD